MKETKINLKITENIRKGVSGTVLLLPGLLVALPVLLLITGSVMDQYELEELLQPLFRERGAGEAFRYISVFWQDSFLSEYRRPGLLPFIRIALESCFLCSMWY